MNVKSRWMQLQWELLRKLYFSDIWGFFSSSSSSSSATKMYHIHIMQKKTFPTHSRFCLQFTLPFFFFLLPVFHLLYWEKFHRKMMIHSWDKWHEEGNESFCIYFMEKRKKKFFLWIFARRISRVYLKIYFSL